MLFQIAYYFLLFCKALPLYKQFEQAKAFYAHKHMGKYAKVGKTACQNAIIFI